MEINDPEAIQAQNDATRVRLNAVLISIRNESSEQVLQLQTGLRLFQARLNCKNGQLPHLTPGSQLELTGVLVSLEKNQVANQILKSFELLINSPADIRLLSRPPWWNLKRLLVALGLLTGVLAGATLWIQQLHRKVEERTTQLQYEITERERIERHAAVEGERSRIARDLHDDLGSSLTEINLLGTMGLEGDPAAGNECLSQIVNKAGIR
jgi:signal transduction histidine kinase